MGELILENSQIDDKLKKIAFQRNISFVISIFCFIFGLLYLSTLRGYHESELIVTFKFIPFVVLIFTGLYVLYIFSQTSLRVLRYYNKIKPLHFDQININYKFILSKKKQIYIMFSGFANGVYFIKLKKKDDRSLLNEKAKKLPQFIIKLNKKIKLDNLSIKYGEFSDFFKIPLNNKEFIAGNAIIFFMPLVTFSKTQNNTDYIIKMIDLVQEKSF